MKKLITYSALCLLTVMLLTACGSQRSYTKNRYNNRYYIGMSKAEKGSKEKSESTEENTTLEKEEVVGSNDLDNPNLGTINQSDNQKAAVDSATSNTSIFTEPAGQPVELTLKDRLKSLKKIKNPLQKNTNETPFNLTEKAENVKEKLSPQASEGDVLSLLWIVIVIILIVWLIGVLFGGFGVGGAIHLLLVIALILLILWLLGII